MSKQKNYRAFVPLMLLAAAVTSWLGYATMQLMQEREDLRLNGEKQQPVIEQAGKIRAQVQTISEGLQTLSEQGNDNAAETLRRLEAMGIRLRRKEAQTEPLPEG